MREKAIVRIVLTILSFRQRENRSTYRAALRSTVVLEALTAELAVRAEAEMGAIGDGSFMQFFQWLLDNWEEILKIIMIFMSENKDVVTGFKKDYEDYCEEERLVKKEPIGARLEALIQEATAKGIITP